MASASAAYAALQESPRQNFANVLPSLCQLQLRLENEHRSVERLFAKEANRVLSSYHSDKPSDIKEMLQRHEQTFARLTAELTRLNEQAQKMCQAEVPLATSAMNAARGAILCQRSLRDRLDAAVPNMETVMKLGKIVGKLYRSEGSIAPEVSEQIQKDLAETRERASSEYMPANVRSLIDSVPAVLAIAAKQPYNHSFYDTLKEILALFPKEDIEEYSQGFNAWEGTLRELDESARKMEEEAAVIRERLSGFSGRIDGLVNALEETGASIKAAFGEYQGLQSRAAALSGKQAAALKEMVQVQDDVIRTLQRSGQETDSLRGQIEELRFALKQTEQRSRAQLEKAEAERDALSHKAQAFQTAVTNIDAWVATVRGQIAPAQAAQDK